MSKFFVCSFYLLVTFFSHCQTAKKIKLIHSDELFGGLKYGDGINLLKGNVVLNHGNYVFKSDSTYLNNPKNTVQSIGSVYINIGDTLHLFGNELFYEGDLKYAMISGNVRMIDKDMTLTTDTLYFDGKKNIAFFYSGGKVVDQNSSLKSKEGVYNTDSEDFNFKEKVYIDHLKYTIDSDNLTYNRVDGKLLFFGPTVIFHKDDSTAMYTEKGKYNLNTEIGELAQNSKISNKTQIIKGDSLFYDKKRGLGIAKGNVFLKDNKDLTTIKGGYGEFHEFQDSSFVVKRAVVIKYFLKDSIITDSLFIQADTLSKVTNQSSKNIILRAYYNTKVYKSDLQGRCDSLLFNESTGDIKMFYKPILWLDKNQITGDTIIIKTLPKQKKIDSLFVLNNALMASKIDSLEFNQVKGNKILGKFEENILKTIDVTGNAESIYFVDDADKIDIKTGKPERIGVNKSVCRTINILLNNKKISSVSCLTKAKSIIFPETKIDLKDLRFKEFIWREDERISNIKDLFEK